MKNKSVELSSEDLSELCLQLYTLMSSGIPAEECFQLMKEDADSAAQRRLYKSLEEMTGEGMPLSGAFRRTENFPDYMTEMIQTGEQTGMTEEVLRALSAYFEREAGLKKSVKNAVRFPAFMIILMGVLLIVLQTFVMPVFQNAFASAGIVLSDAAGRMMSAGEISVRCALGLLAAVLAAGLFFWFDGKTGKPGLLRKTDIMRRVSAGRFASVMALMLHSGIPMEESVRRAGAVSQCEMWEQIACKMEEGSTLSGALQETKLFSGFFLRMIRVGERSGCMEQMLEEAAGRMNQKTSEIIDGWVARIEPAAVMILAVSAGMAMLSVLLPLLGAVSGI